MKLSTFNIVARTGDGNRVLSNSVTGGACVISEKHYNMVRKSLGGKLTNEEVEALTKDLRKGGFIVDNDVDELTRVKYLSHYGAYKGDYLDLRILPTEQCNFRCAYCYESFEKGEMTPEIRGRIKLLLEKKAPHIKRLFLGWFGGEPLIAIDTISDLSETILELKGRFDFRYESNITTNGFFLSGETMSKLLLFGIKRVQVTIDGNKDEHDERRKLLNGGRTFDVIMDNLRAIKGLNDDFDFTVRINFDMGNTGSIYNFLDLLRNILVGDKRFAVFFRSVSNCGGPNNEIEKLALVPSEKSIMMQLKFQEEALRKGLRVANASVMPKLNSFLCYAALPHSFTIGSDGTVYKCTIYFGHDINKIGYVDEKGTLKLDVNKVAQWVGYKGGDDSHCQKWASTYDSRGIINACPQARTQSIPTQGSSP